MTNVTTRLLINRFDSDQSVEEVELDHQEPISSVKERLFAEDITNHHKIRIIHGGRPLSDDTVPSGLRGYKAGEKLVLTVFITKPDTLEPEAESGTCGNGARPHGLWLWRRCGATNLSSRTRSGGSHCLCYTLQRLYACTWFFRALSTSAE
ncbi:hypothetical protein, conserved [Babesia bigemina]|uniref:Ubiquitin-like domain-containing protein n=1 Tax=Babesia bigemina TaxID=5866 RepID=A0A061D9C4_BABBI|nr:hypothetical protein, conserved [Babesia bigemina]CDR96592.1 hypothetical protein, conserved [Babesia bigemina]|eukprot:XP_012768778.1 hypothetical protein, conserved [Babesia bigemina]